ncbi:MAG: heme-copper oxidase subunit III [Halobacteriales archaeon]
MAEAETGDPGTPARQGTGAEGFPHGSKYPLFVGAGFFFVGLALAWAYVFLIIGVPVLLYGLWGWTREYAIEEYERGVIPEQKRQLLGIETGLLGMYFLIISEILVFAGFFVAWFYLDATRGPFPPEGYPGLTLSLGAVMTGLMLVGSLTARYGRNAIRNGSRSGLVRGFAATLAAGIAFLATLAVEWNGLLAEGLRWTTGPYGASYYALSGLHAGHLIGGLVMVAIVIYRAAARSHFSPSRNLMVRTTEAYWHFLTAISLAIFLFVYFGTA